jgi:uncharacterized membrane-anchored protein
MERMMRKVPQITIFFWIVKILTTALGESTSDYLVRTIDPVIAVFIGFVVFAIALTMQFRARRYNPWIYWFAVAMVAVFGTMAADVLHIGLGIPYLYSTIFFAVALIAVFVLWYGVEHSLSIHSINTRRRELFYWLTVVTTFALGTAAGDMTASTFGLGYLNSGILFAILIAVVAFIHVVTKSVMSAEHHPETRNAVLAFWLAYILTRPLGASFADWMGKAASLGGLGWGDGPVAAGFTVVIVLFVSYLAISRIDVESV